MPQIGPNLWKTAVSYTWYHKFRNGREEYEFDPMTGAPRRWSKPAPEEIEIAGWLPITMDLAKKIQVYGEFGIPTASPSVLINLLPGDDLVIERSHGVQWAEGDVPGMRSNNSGADSAHLLPSMRRTSRLEVPEVREAV